VQLRKPLHACRKGRCGGANAARNPRTKPNAASVFIGASRICLWAARPAAAKCEFDARTMKGSRFPDEGEPSGRV
jgi:hypothetical protein